MLPELFLGNGRNITTCTYTSVQGKAVRWEIEGFFKIRNFAAYYLGSQIPKFGTATRAILKFDTAAHHSIKIDMRHAIEETHDTIPLLGPYLRQTTPALPIKQSINVGYLFFRKRFWGWWVCFGKHCQGTMCLNHDLSKAMQICIIQWNITLLTV